MMDELRRLNENPNPPAMLGRILTSSRKWYKRKGSSLECQNCFFVYPIIDSNLKNLPISNQKENFHSPLHSIVYFYDLFE